jgi:hypothetical protein
MLRFRYRHDAEFAQGYLHEVGIPARVLSDDAGGVDPGMGFLWGAVLTVPARDLDRSAEVLRNAGILGED